MNRNIFMIVIVSLLNGLATCAAEEVPSFILDEVLITATRTEQTRNQIPNATVVISREQIERSGAKDIGTLLEGYTGIYLQRKDNHRYLLVRGFNARYCLILLNGKRVPSEPEKDFEIDRIMLQNVERIEIVKGPMSGVYGSDALGGVINIITRKSDKALTEINLRSGWNTGKRSPQNLLSVNVSSGKAGKVGIDLSAETNYNQKVLRNDSTSYYPFGRQNSFAGKVAYAFDERSNLEFEASYIKENDHEYGTFRSMVGLLYTDLYNHNSRNLYSLTYKNKREKDDWMIRSYRSILHKYNDTLNRKINKYINSIYAYYSMDGFEIQDSHKFNEKNTLTIGADIRKEVFKGTGITTGRGKFLKHYHGKFYEGSEDKNIYYGAFIQDEWTVSPKLFVIGSVRYDDSQELEGRISPKIGATYNVKNNWNLKFNAGQGFKIPTSNQRFLNLFVMRNGVMTSVKGNPDLKAEKSTSWDITTEHVSGNTKYLLTYFDNSVKDMIDEVWVSPKAKEYKNINRAKIRGVEAQVSGDTGRKLEWKANYTYLNAKNSITDKKLPNRAKHTITGQLTYTPNDKWDFDLRSITRLGEVCETSADENQKKNYTTVDFTVNRHFGKNHTLHFGIENIGNYKDNILSYAGKVAYAGYRFNF